MRRVARRCQVSCAAPYKHFENREDLFLEIIKSIDRQWSDVQQKVLADCSSAPLREKIVLACMAYIRFLCSHPEYQAIIFMQGQVVSRKFTAQKTKISKAMLHLLDEYCSSSQMPEDVSRRKIFNIQGYIYGIVVLISSGSADPVPETFDMIRTFIEREFETE